jgi:hypothetical protein
VTPLSKSLQRRTIGTHHGRRLVVILEPGDVIGFRAERTRKVFYTTLAARADTAMRQAVIAAKQAKRKGKK